MNPVQRFQLQNSLIRGTEFTPRFQWQQYTLAVCSIWNRIQSKVRIMSAHFWQWGWDLAKWDYTCTVWLAHLQQLLFAWKKHLTYIHAYIYTCTYILLIMWPWDYQIAWPECILNVLLHTEACGKLLLHTSQCDHVNWTDICDHVNWTDISQLVVNMRYKVLQGWGQ